MSDPIERLSLAFEGRYRVLRVLGEGGMATVYLADDLRHERRVAVKVLKPALSADLGSDRFLREIRTTAGLQHPHIVPLFDSGEVDGLLYFVMPHLEGESLREFLAREGGRLGVEEAVRIVMRLGEALGYAHQKGVLHRDIKPANVLISNGEPLLADFGIARMLGGGDGAPLTQAGASIGTPGYMSPEQAAGEGELGEASDVYSLGALLYELLTGAPPFGSANPMAVLAKILTEDPPAASDVDPTVPRDVSDVVAKALARDPADRPGSAKLFVDMLGAATAPAPGSRGAPPWLLALFAAVVLVGGALWARAASQARWVRVEALPEIQRLAGEGRRVEAFDLAVRALELVPDDALLAGLYDAVSDEQSFVSVPQGALVSYRPYDREDTVWTRLGVTPLTGVALPADELLLRFELEGFRPVHISMLPLVGTTRAELVSLDDDPVVRLPGGSTSVTGPAVVLDAFEIDEHEVTNEAYQQFVGAGYAFDTTVWVEPFRTRGVDVDLDRMIAEFVDQTGRPAPAGWELGRHSPGDARLPVQGVSWFEAVAYCSWRGSDLPTYHHWKHADAGEISAWDGVLQHANLGEGADGPVPVGSTQAYSARGVADLAGNVREWVWNAAGSDRYILGGAWESPPHIYTDFDAADPWSRSPENGFRCARFDGAPEAELFADIGLPIFDFTGYEPVDDATYANFASLYEYDRAPVNESRVVIDETQEWTRERVEIDAAYLDERIPVHVFLPKGVEPPYQTVVYVPGGSAFFLPGSDNISEMAELMFLPQSGRALVYPVLSGMYERQHDRPSRGDAERRQRYIWVVQDIMRTVDFIDQRPDLDLERTAYMGLSWGAEWAVPVALEKRFRATVLIGGALDPAWLGVVPEAAAPWNFVSRITTPTLLVNGQYDFMHPYEESQVPFFDMIDVPDDDKSFVVLPTGHLPPNNDVIAHTLRWLDERMGPVARVR